MKNIEEIIKNTKELMISDHSLSIALDFERVLSEFDLYAFKNWLDGELVEGPKVEKYHVSCTFMWSKEDMPDPDGAKRLLNHGCEIVYKKSNLIKPVKIKSPDDYRPGTKFAQLEKHPVWLVEIVIPKEMLENIDFSVIEPDEEEVEDEIDGEEMPDENLDDLDFETGEEDETQQQ